MNTLNIPLSGFHNHPESAFNPSWATDDFVLAYGPLERLNTVRLMTKTVIGLFSGAIKSIQSLFVVYGMSASGMH